MRFGNAPAPYYRVESPTRLVAVSPPGRPGTVDVTATNALGSSSPGVGARFVVAEENWSETEEMFTARREHTATRLSGPACRRGSSPEPAYCGGVLVPSSATNPEVYDAQRRTWFTTDGPMVNDDWRARPPHCSTVPPATVQTRPRTAGTCSSSARHRCSATRASAQLFDPVSGQWSATEAPRTCTPSACAHVSQHLATALHDGSVLLLGGRESRTAERYDPSSGRWTLAGSYLVPRSGHTVTLLRDGRVLVVGGDARGTAELYDPRSNTWVLAAPMSGPRSYHTATALPDGKVLVAGGQTGAFLPRTTAPADGALNPHGAALATAEVFDPGGGGAGSWAPVAPMSRPRLHHTATVLGTNCGDKCGRVLVAGGLDVTCSTGAGDCPPPTDTAELYDPATSTWHGISFSAIKRFRHSATLLDDGTVLVAGGAELDHDVIRTFDLSSAQLYTPSPRPPRPRVDDVRPGYGPTFGGSEVTLVGRGLFPTAGVRFGGAAAAVTFSSDTELTVVSPPGAQGTAPVEVSTPVGASAVDAARSAFTYGEGVWEPARSLAGCPGVSRWCVGRTMHTATALDGPPCRSASPPRHCGKVLLAGGDRSGSAQLYDPANGTWEPTGAMLAPRYEHSATLLPDGKVLIVGGRDGVMVDGALETAELYDPDATATVDGVAVSGAFRPAGSLGDPRFAHTATVLDGPPCGDTSRPAWCGAVLVAGGTGSLDGRPPLRSTELYVPGPSTATGGEGTWRRAGDLVTGRGNHAATLLPTGEVLVTGGFGAGDGTPRHDENLAAYSSVLSSAELFVPSESGGGWRTTAEMSVARAAHTATLLNGRSCAAQCGKVLVTGGLASVTHFRDRSVYLRSTELFERRAETWAPGPVMHDVRAGHSATLLPDGNVLVAGSSSPVDELGPPALASAEVYEPVLGEAGRLTYTSGMRAARGVHTATLLHGTPCTSPDPPRYCGTVLVVGGSDDAFTVSEGSPPALMTAELYRRAPVVTAVTPNSGRSTGGTPVTVRGERFEPASTVSFGGARAGEVTVLSSTMLTAVAPRHPAGQVEVSVTNDAGTSAHQPPRLRGQAFSYGASSPPRAIHDLAARAVSHDTIVLTFSAPGADGEMPAEPPAVARYIVKQFTGSVQDGSAVFDEGVSQGRLAQRRVGRLPALRLPRGAASSRRRGNVSLLVHTRHYQHCRDRPLTTPLPSFGSLLGALATRETMGQPRTFGTLSAPFRRRIPAMAGSPVALGLAGADNAHQHYCYVDFERGATGDAADLCEAQDTNVVWHRRGCGRWAARPRGRRLRLLPPGGDRASPDFRVSRRDHRRHGAGFPHVVGGR